MARESVTIVKHREALAHLGLTALAGARAFRGELIKNHRGRRDIFRIPIHAEDGRPVTLFLKRNLIPYRKHGLASLLRRARVWSAARVEWENCRALEAAGLPTAPLVAFGEECGLLWERYSFIITEAAPGDETLADFIRTCGDGARRRRVIEGLARLVRRLHEAGLATPDLFARHLFLSWRDGQPEFCLIDMARLDRVQPVPDRLRARDLAALNLTAPLRDVSWRERFRFLHGYAGRDARRLRVSIERRVRHLLSK
ncbi:MAG TPA: lipopolysaccharide kinase InaA family protein, partial [Methylomirabilota bacterium]|nr:lipopolysaccharide kinase InaA family protein [Methylomirabilota bacterium]